MLDMRAQAVIDRDRSAFMATIEPGAEEFRLRQSRLFTRMAPIPLDSYELRAAWERYGDLARPSDRRTYKGASSVSIPVTEERYRIEGIDSTTAVEDMYYTFVERKGRWYIADDSDLDDLTLYSTRHMWDFGPIETVRDPELVLYSHPCDGGGLCDSEVLLAAARDALDRLHKYWTDVPARVLILVPGDQEEVERMIQATFDLDNFVAFAYSTVDTSKGIEYTGHRIILNPPAFGGRSTESSTTILAHELLHVATRESSGPFMPVFVDEGFAEYVGYDADPSSLAFLDSEIAAGTFDAQVPEDFEFTIGTGTDIYRSYQKSESAITFFIRRWGLERFRRFYRSLGRVKIEPGTARYWLDVMLRRFTELNVGKFEKAWADSIAGT